MAVKIQVIHDDNFNPTRFRQLQKHLSKVGFIFKKTTKRKEGESKVNVAYFEHN